MRIHRPKIVLTLAILLCGLGGVARAAEVEGVRFEEKLQLDNSRQELVLNGAGVRTKFMMKVYAIGLYLPEKLRRGDEVLHHNGPKRVVISILMREITTEQFMSALRDKLDSDLSPAELRSIHGSLDQINEIMLAVKSLKRGNVVALEYVPGYGTRVVINGEVRGNYIPNEEFYRALLTGWIGDRPVNEKLKRALLGQV
jgi:hypothetical protein